MGLILKFCLNLQNFRGKMYLYLPPFKLNLKCGNIFGKIYERYCKSRNFELQNEPDCSSSLINLSYSVQIQFNFSDVIFRSSLFCGISTFALFRGRITGTWTVEQRISEDGEGGNVAMWRGKFSVGSGKRRSHVYFDAPSAIFTADPIVNC